MRLLAVVLALALARAVDAGDIPGRVALIGLDHQVYLADPNGGEPRPLTRGEPGRVATGDAIRLVSAVDESGPSGFRFSYPTWAPDGRSLLVLGTRVAGDGRPQSAGLYRIAADRPGAVTPLWEDARRSPIYAFWSPNGERAAALVTDGGAISLALIDVPDGRLVPVSDGFPFYFAWRDDGRAIVAHTGGAAEENHPAQVSLIDLGGGAKPKVKKVSDQPAGFRAPSWSPDGGFFAWVGREPGKKAGAIYLEPRAGGERRTLAPVTSRIVFVWTPDGRSLTVGDAAAPDSPLFAGVNLVSLDDGRREPLYAGATAGFFWSPDARRLLVANPEFDSGEWRWLVIDVATKRVREVGRFLPSPDFQMLMTHFDQYTLSHRVWAPDSRHFVYAAYPASTRNESEPVPPGVWIVDAENGTSRRVGDGRSAFWSPK